MGVAPGLQAQMVYILNTSLANSTWTGIRAIKNSIDSLAQKYSLELSMPWGRDKVVNYILACTMEKLAPSTIKTYVSRIASLHRCLGSAPRWEGEDIRLLMRGVANLPRSPDSPKRRLAITPAVLRTLWEKLTGSSMPDTVKKMMWAAACLLYAGSVRSCELLSPSKYSFDPTTTMRRCDLQVVREMVGMNRVKYLKLSVKNPKEFRQAGTVVVEILPCKGMFFCPVAAVTEFLRVTPGYSRSMPLLRTEKSLLSRDWLNAVLKNLLDPVLDYGVIRSHSFRAGLTSALAKAGVSDEVLQSLGRWHSQAYNAYIKLGRSLRLSTQEELVRKISLMADSDWGVSTTLLVA